MFSCNKFVIENFFIYSGFNQDFINENTSDRTCMQLLPKKQIAGSYFQAFTVSEKKNEMLTNKKETLITPADKRGYIYTHNSV